MITVLVVDDHPLFRDGLTGLLDTVPDVTVLDAVGDGEAAVARAAELEPDVVLMDLNLPGMPGLEAIRRILADRPQTGVLVLTMVDDDGAVASALRMGARGYVLKGAAQEEVLAALRTVASGGALLGTAGAERALTAPRLGVLSTLTPRESQVLALIAAGRSNTDIARELGPVTKVTGGVTACPRDEAG
ncbi:response regulator transcription factor, partial [Fodinibacter luteus]|uniref:response regulator transcription factor n=1 Tax=Fodinibacter luteus TaxID=552064 RepID=UPI0031E82FC8